MQNIFFVLCRVREDELKKQTETNIANVIFFAQQKHFHAVS